MIRYRYGDSWLAGCFGVRVFACAHELAAWKTNITMLMHGV